MGVRKKGVFFLGGERAVVWGGMGIVGDIRGPSPPLEHGCRLVENLFKGHRPPSRAYEACSRRCGNWRSRSDVCIPHMVDRKKQEVLGARDTAVSASPENWREVFQSCGYATLSQTQRHPKRSEGSDDYPSAALSLLRRDRYRPTWHVA